MNEYTGVVKHNNDMMLFFYWCIVNNYLIKSEEDYERNYTIFLRGEKINKLNDNITE